MGTFRDELSLSWRYRGREELAALNVIRTGTAARFDAIFTNQNAAWPKVFYVAVYVSSIGADISTVNFQIWTELRVRQAVMSFVVTNSLQATFSVPGNALIGVNLLNRPNAALGDKLLLRSAATLRPPPFLGEEEVEFAVDVLAYN
ncbi:MAG: hypothetical protein L0Z48_12475 [candidate division Zixibacteria bacterium]|nr:hypothetical protein [candidate division Zixibacteria bacterium]